MVAWSVTEDPTVIAVCGVVEVAMIGLVLLTVRGSQALVAPLLLASPEYTALKLKVPVLLKTTDLEDVAAPFVTVAVDTNLLAAEQMPFGNSL